MPTWGDVLIELRASINPQTGQPDFDGVRRRHLARLAALTGRSTILYYTDWLAGAGGDVSITLEDIQALMEVCNGLPGGQLDLILHTPGGVAEATASLVHYLRGRYDDIRVFVPIAAMSAGTMWALSGNRLVMGSHSQLGPIDPQMLSGNRFVPARAIVEQFDKAKEEIAREPQSLQAWFPILQQYGPALLSECADAEALSKRLVGQWLRDYMFAGRDDAETRAHSAADYFADYDTHRSHALGITREMARDRGILVDDLEADQDLQDAVLTVHHATMHTLGGGPAVKIVENQLGRAYVKIRPQIALPNIVQG